MARGQPVADRDWLHRLAPGAAATIAIGTCATWGGVPAAEGNPTGAMSVMDSLGKDYRSRVRPAGGQHPGVRPVKATTSPRRSFAVLLFLQGLGPLPDLRRARPAGVALRRHRASRLHPGRLLRGGRLRRGLWRPECLVEIGCWGPVVKCNIVQRGGSTTWAGCMNAGGICIGCTMPGFPDKFSPFYKTPPGAIVSTFAARSVGAVVRRLRRLSNREANREHRWDVTHEVPSGWAHVQAQTVTDRTIKFFYSVWQHLGAKKPGRPASEKDRFWGADRPGYRSDYIDGSAAREDSDDRR